MSSVEFRKDLFADERDDTLKEIGKPTIRQDILGHVTGRTPFYDDHAFEGLLHMRCVRSPHHHANIRRVDASAAERMEGVVRVVMPSDVPVNLNTLLHLIGFGKDDEPLLADKKATYIGEPVCAVIATSERIAREACDALKVDWEVLPHVLDVEEALKPDAPSVNPAYPNNTFDYGRFDHQKLRFGDVQEGFVQSDVIVEHMYQMSPIEQAPMETCGAIAAPETNDRIVCYTATQAMFFSLGNTAKVMNMPSSRLHFVGGTVGGGFGGKVDSIVDMMAVLGAKLTGRAVKFQWDRAEEMQVGAPRGAERWYIKDGLSKDGRILARQFTGFFDGGAYTRLSSYAVQKCVGHLPGPYTIPNVAANVYLVYTNRTPATAMRGFGVTGVDFALECHMDKDAEAVGMDPIEFRILNAYRDGDMKAHRREAKNTALVECCQVAAQKAGWSLSPAMMGESSKLGSTPERAAIPETAIDQEGLIGARRQGEIPTAPAVRSTGTRPAGQRTDARVAVAPQVADMQIDPDRVGHQTKVAPTAPMSAPSTTPAPMAAVASAPSIPATPSPQPAFAPATSSPPPVTPAATESARETPFQRGVNRPGLSPFLSGRRRR
ncbi:MAG: molybdopterin cofactor-binding domain-containing protein [Pseudomonadota bacterium]